MLVSLTTTEFIIAATSPAPAPSFFSSQLFGIIVGGVISAAVSFVGSWIIYKQQQRRDKDAYNRQVEREELAHRRQIEREQEAYKRSIRGEKRERLRTLYKVLLNASDAYQVEAGQMGHIPKHENISLTDVDETVTEISLEDVNEDVLSIFFDLRGAFHELTVRWSIHEEGGGEGILKQKHKVTAKVEELKITMNKHLNELEQ